MASAEAAPSLANAADALRRDAVHLPGAMRWLLRRVRAVHESMQQRLIVQHHLRGLDREELDPYLAHRLRLAGCEVPLFDPPAIEALYQSARGLPRLINRIAHYALSAAAVGDARTVDAGHPARAVEDLRP